MRELQKTGILVPKMLVFENCLTSAERNMENDEEKYYTRKTEAYKEKQWKIGTNKLLYRTDDHINYTSNI